MELSRKDEIETSSKLNDRDDKKSRNDEYLKNTSEKYSVEDLANSFFHEDFINPRRTSTSYYFKKDFFTFHYKNSHDTNHDSFKLPKSKPAILRRKLVDDKNKEVLLTTETTSVLNPIPSTSKVITTATTPILNPITSTSITDDNNEDLSATKNDLGIKDQLVENDCPINKNEEQSCKQIKILLKRSNKNTTNENIKRKLTILKERLTKTQDCQPLVIETSKNKQKQQNVEPILHINKQQLQDKNKISNSGDNQYIEPVIERNLKIQENSNCMKPFIIKVVDVFDDSHKNSVDKNILTSEKNEENIVDESKVLEANQADSFTSYNSGKIPPIAVEVIPPQPEICDHTTSSVELDQPQFINLYNHSKKKPVQASKVKLNIHSEYLDKNLISEKVLTINMSNTTNPNDNLNFNESFNHNLLPDIETETVHIDENNLLHDNSPSIKMNDDEYKKDVENTCLDKVDTSEVLETEEELIDMEQDFENVGSIVEIANSDIDDENHNNSVDVKDQKSVDESSNSDYNLNEMISDNFEIEENSNKEIHIESNLVNNKRKLSVLSEQLNSDETELPEDIKTKILILEKTKNCRRKQNFSDIREQFSSKCIIQETYRRDENVETICENSNTENDDNFICSIEKTFLTDLISSDSNSNTAEPLIITVPKQNEDSDNNQCETTNLEIYDENSSLQNQETCSTKFSDNNEQSSSKAVESCVDAKEESSLIKNKEEVKKIDDSVESKNLDAQEKYEECNIPSIKQTLTDKTNSSDLDTSHDNTKNFAGRKIIIPANTLAKDKNLFQKFDSSKNMSNIKLSLLQQAVNYDPVKILQWSEQNEFGFLKNQNQKISFKLNRYGLLQFEDLEQCSETEVSAARFIPWNKKRKNSSSSNSAKRFKSKNSVTEENESTDLFDILNDENSSDSISDDSDNDVTNEEINKDNTFKDGSSSSNDNNVDNNFGQDIDKSETIVDENLELVIKEEKDLTTLERDGKTQVTDICKDKEKHKTQKRPSLDEIELNWCWDKYLFENNFDRTNFMLFNNAFPDDKNNFTVGQKLETVDPNYEAYFCVVTVAEVKGYRLKLVIDNYPYDCSFWVNYDNPYLFYVGFAYNNGYKIRIPENKSWEAYEKSLVAKGVVAAKKVFRKIKMNYGFNFFEVGMKLEAAFRKNMENMCVATVASKLNDSLLVHFDSTREINDYWVNKNSPYIRPVGWCKQNNVILNAPADYRLSPTFDWKLYLKYTESTAAPNKAFMTRRPASFIRGTKLEAIDIRAPHLLRVATIAEIHNYEVKISFDGYPDMFGYWTSDDSPDIHPIGWSDCTGHKITPPPNISDFTKYKCNTPGCTMDGNSKNVDLNCHYSSKFCPYDFNNLLKTNNKFNAAIIKKDDGEHRNMWPKLFSNNCNRFSIEHNSESDDSLEKETHNDNLINNFENYFNKFKRTVNSFMMWDSVITAKFLIALKIIRKEHGYWFKENNMTGLVVLMLTLDDFKERFNLGICEYLRLKCLKDFVLNYGKDVNSLKKKKLK